MDQFTIQYRDLYWLIRKEIEALAWQINMQMGNQVFIQRQLENLAENRVPALCLKDKFKGKTGVLLGGGPSLDEVLPWVQEHRDKLVIVAVSRVCRRLLDFGVQPHVVVSIDPHPISFDVSKELLRYESGTLLVASHHITPLLAAQWQGPMVYLGPAFPWETSLNVENLPNQGPTVTNTALTVAIEMGLSQIVLAGVDLCYTRDGMTHAKGSNEHKVGPLLGSVNVQVETNGGWMAETRHSFSNAVSMMGNQARNALNRDCRIVNPAAGAARIPNVDFIALEDIEFEPMTQSAESLIDELLPASDSQARSAHNRGMQRELARVNGRLRRIRALTEDALKCNDGLFGRKGMTADFKYKKRMDKIERRLDKEFDDLTPLVKTYGMRHFLRLVRPDKSKEWSDEEIEATGKRYYEAYRASADTVLKVVKRAQTLLKARMQEEQEHVPIEQLADHWEKEHTPGRADVWKQRHQERIGQLSVPQQQRLEKLHNDFESEMSCTETAQMRWSRDNYTLKPVRGKAAVLFENESVQELQTLADSLGKSTQDEAEELHQLVLGYLAELSGEPKQALQHYAAVTSAPQVEDALRRISILTLEIDDAHNALLALDCLAAISPIYEPQYAELLRLLNRPQDALDAYTEYLKKAPDDLGTMLKLGRLYEDMEVWEAARWAYGYVLELDPKNSAAQELLQRLPVAKSESSL